jgi:hypothetical protein
MLTALAFPPRFSEIWRISMFPTYKEELLLLMAHAAILGGRHCEQSDYTCLAKRPESILRSSGLR